MQHSDQQRHTTTNNNFTVCARSPHPRIKRHEAQRFESASTDCRQHLGNTYIHICVQPEQQPCHHHMHPTMHETSCVGAGGDAIAVGAITWPDFAHCSVCLVNKTHEGCTNPQQLHTQKEHNHHHQQLHHPTVKKHANAHAHAAESSPTTCRSASGVCCLSNCIGAVMPSPCFSTVQNALSTCCCVRHNHTAVATATCMLFNWLVGCTL